MKILIYSLCLSVLSLSTASHTHAAWRGVTGKISGITTYNNRDIVLVSLQNQPTGPAPSDCAISAFAIDGNVTAERRQQMLSLLLSAQMAGRDIGITWEDAGSCVVFNSTTKFVQIVRINTTP
ncbi:MAG: hypothetical protein AAGA36_03140 [Pseudomonadota bacterium]